MSRCCVSFECLIAEELKLKILDKNVEKSPKFLTRFDQDSILGRVQFEFGVNISEIDCITN